MGGFRYCKCYQHGINIPIPACIQLGHVDAAYCYKVLQNLIKYDLIDSLPREAVSNRLKCIGGRASGGLMCQEKPNDLRKISSDLKTKTSPYRFENLFLVSPQLYPVFKEPIVNAYNSIAESERIVYMDYERTLAGFEAYANQIEENTETGRYYMQGAESAFRTLRGYIILNKDAYSSNNNNARAMYKTFQRLIEAGIHGLWENWNRILFPSFSDRLLKKYKAQGSSPPKRLTLSSNTGSVFVILGVCILISTSAFCGEYLFHWYTYVFSLLRIQKNTQILCITSPSFLRNALYNP